MKDQPVHGSRLNLFNLLTVCPHVDEIEQLKAQIVRLRAHVRELEKLAHLDPLVRLPNRRGLFRDLENLIARLNRYGGSAAMIFVDIDGLKQINDRFGHPTGDAALIKTAQILVQGVRSFDTVARLSGDEFVILMSDVDELGAWNMALRLVEATVEAPNEINSFRVPLSIAVGVSPINAGDRPENVISRADKSMYRIKAT